MITMNKYDAFIEIAEEILTHPKFIEQRDFHHHTSNLFEHAVHVAYTAYRVAKKLRLDVKSVVRGALLHDFFLYDWHIEGKRVRKRGFKKHGFTHAKIAYENADTYFDLNRKERDIILKHMFPLNFKPPRYKESWVVNMVDSYVTFKEYFKKHPNELYTYIINKYEL